MNIQKIHLFSLLTLCISVSTIVCSRAAAYKQITQEEEQSETNQLISFETAQCNEQKNNQQESALPLSQSGSRSVSPNSVPNHLPEESISKFLSYQRSAAQSPQLQQEPSQVGKKSRQSTTPHSKLGDLGTRENLTPEVKATLQSLNLQLPQNDQIILAGIIIKNNVEGKKLSLATLASRYNKTPHEFQYIFASIEPASQEILIRKFNLTDTQLSYAPTPSSAIGSTPSSATSPKPTPSPNYLSSKDDGSRACVIQ